MIVSDEGSGELRSPLLDHVPAAMVATDLSGSIIHWNRQAEILFGWSRQEVLGRRLGDLKLGPHDPDTGKDILDRIAAGQTWHGEVPLHQRDGSTIQCEIWNSPVHDANGTLVAVTVVAADITERRRSADRRAAQYAVTKVLAEARSLEEATPRILRALCESLGWEMGGIWAVDPGAEQLRCVDTWQAGSGLEEFARASRETPLGLGVGLPGRAWEERRPVWIPDVTDDGNFPRAAAAHLVGLHAGMAFPIMLEAEVLGVIESFGREILEPDPELLEMMAATGSGIGQFVERIRAETERVRLLERERTAREQAEAAERRQAFLAEASELLDSSLDYEATLATLARLAVPLLADWCLVDVMDEDGRVQPLAITHVDPAKARLAETLRRRYPFAPELQFLSPNVLRTGRSELYEDVPDELLQAVAPDEAVLRLLRALGLRSAMAVPMTARGRTFGVITLVAAESGARYRPEDLALAEDLGRRAALAVDNARLFRDANEASRRKDESLGLLNTLARQQAAVAHLGQSALESVAPAQLVRDAVRLVAETLGVTHSSVHELLPDGLALRLTAAAGWEPGRTGPWEVPADERSLLGRALTAMDPVEAEDLSAGDGGDADALGRHGVASSVATVIRGPGRPYGVLSAHNAARRTFTKDDVHFLQSVANVLATAMQRTAAEEALRQSEERLLLALDAGNMGTWDWDLPTGRIAWSGKLEEIYGLEPGTYDGTFAGVVRLIHPEDRGRVVEEIWRSVESGGEYSSEFRVVGSDGSVRWIASDGQVIRAEDGEAVRMLGVGMDVTERRQADEERTRLLELESAARADAEVAQIRLTFLAEAGAILTSSLDYPQTLQNLARAAVPGLADMCLVDMIEDGRLVRAAAVHADPAKGELVRELQANYPPYDPEGIHPVTKAIRTGKPAFSPEITEDFIRKVTREGHHRRLVHAIGFRSYLCVPLVTGGRTLGAISFISTTPGRRYTEADASLADDLGRRAAQALENARLFRERSHIARTLQRSLLPNRLPHIPGVELAGRYRAAGEGAEVGGDFYDVFDTGERGWGLVIGDVCGKGPDAAAVTGLARYTIRAAAMQESRPSRILSLLNEAVMQQGAEQGFCTVCYVRLRRAQAGSRITVCCAGHPLPLLLRADGTVEFIGTPGTLLGIFPDPELTDLAMDLGPGDALVLYTDGVIEEHNPSELFGTERLADVVRSCAGLDAEGIAAAIERAVNEFLPGEPRDDIALLVLRMRP